MYNPAERTARVLVVDDSAAMRMMFSGLLEETKGIVVVGEAASADEARELIGTAKPNVLTLDVDMPGTSGLEFLEELMKRNPIPVVILSSLAQKGSATTKEAMALGAISCFGKPMRADSAQFSREMSKLAELVLDAAAVDIYEHLQALREKAVRRVAE